MPRKTLFLIIGLIILTITLLVIALRLEKSQGPTESDSQTENQIPSPTVPMHTTLNLQPNPVNLTSGTGSVDIVIDTQVGGSNDVAGVQLEIGYDTSALTNVNITKAGLFQDAQEIIKDINPDTGRITYILILSPAQENIVGQGLVGKLTFNRNPSTQISQTEIELLPKTAVTASGLNESVLKEKTGTTVIFQ